jgi:hypothetical protein
MAKSRHAGGGLGVRWHEVRNEDIRGAGVRAREERGGLCLSRDTTKLEVFEPDVPQHDVAHAQAAHVRAREGVVAEDVHGGASAWARQHRAGATAHKQQQRTGATDTRVVCARRRRSPRAVLVNARGRKAAWTASPESWVGAGQGRRAREAAREVVTVVGGSRVLKKDNSSRKRSSV